MKTKHNEIEIEYDEQKDKWLFELRGRSRQADSLAAAKAAIDAPVREKKESTFPRQKIWLLESWDGTPTEAEATSLTDEDRYVWVHRR